MQEDDITNITLEDLSMTLQSLTPDTKMKRVWYL